MSLEALAQNRGLLLNSEGFVEDQASLHLDRHNFLAWGDFINADLAGLAVDLDDDLHSGDMVDIDLDDALANECAGLR